MDDLLEIQPDLQELWVLEIDSAMITISCFTQTVQEINIAIHGELEWRIVAQTASVNQVIYDQVGGWFCLVSGGQNHLKLVINTLDLD